MAVVKTNVYCNISGCTFVFGTTPTTINLAEIQDVQRSFKGTELLWQGDAAPGPMKKKVVDKRREVTIIGADLYLLDNLPPGTFGTLTWIEEDLYNGIVTGAVTHVLTNFSFHEDDGGGKHNEIKMGTVKGSSVWTLVSGAYVDPHTATQAP
jgi:hypothetical protein